MPSAVFTLNVPADERYRGLAAEVVRKYLEVAQKDVADRDTFVDSVAEAVDQLAAAGEQIDVTVHTDEAGVGVHLSCGGQQTMLRQPFPAGNR